MRVNTTKDVRSFLKDMEARQMPFAISHSMNSAAFHTRREMIQTMDRYIEGGATRFTKSGLEVVKSSKRRLTTVLQFKANRGYMEEVIRGGTKVARGRRLPEPIKANNPPLTARGNIRRGFQQKAKKHSVATDRYFTGVPSWGRNNSNLYGIWRRPKNRKGRLELVISYARHQRVQRQTYRATEIATTIFLFRYQRQFPISLRRALRTAR